MDNKDDLLRGTTVAVIGFNARPLACSAKRAGARVYVSDYWGDDDLATCSDEWTAVLTPKPGLRQRQHLEQPLYISLAENLLEITKGVEIDHLFVGSGFDDHADGLRALHGQIGITGNSPDLFKSARNASDLAKLANEFGLLYPERRFTKNQKSVAKACKTIGYPCIIRPVSSGGGGGISLVRTSKDIEQACSRATRETAEPGFIVQQYIRGMDASCSVLATGDRAIALSVQGQLVGMPSAGRNCDFAFCGNYTPLKADAQLTDLIETASVDICNNLGLVGTNGFDFVIDSEGNIWLMEVNPRFQGTLEMLELSAGISLTTLHAKACQGRLPSKRIRFKPAAKMIVYSRRTGAVSDLSLFENSVDRTPPGVHVKRGDPICTILEAGRNLRQCYSRLAATSYRIQSEVSRPKK
ncbi:MAG: ATP-grasp domain-containing protein [Promethearchaeota archaeon]